MKEGKPMSKGPAAVCPRVCPRKYAFFVRLRLRLCERNEVAALRTLVSR
jgi:hypothetical protein